MDCHEILNQKPFGPDPIHNLFISLQPPFLMSISATPTPASFNTHIVFVFRRRCVHHVAEYIYIYIYIYICNIQEKYSFTSKRFLSDHLNKNLNLGLVPSWFHKKNLDIIALFDDQRFLNNCHRHCVQRLEIKRLKITKESYYLAMWQKKIRTYTPGAELWQ